MSNRHSGNFCLVDRGANDGLAGTSLGVVSHVHHKHLGIRGFQNQEAVDILITNVVCFGKAKPTHSSGRMKYHGLGVNIKLPFIEGDLQ